MNATAPRLGSIAAAMAAAAVLAYGAAQIGQVLGLIGYPLADMLIFATSLLIAPPFVLAMLALHEAAPATGRMWSRGALLFAGIYCAFAWLTYAVQLVTVIPRAPTAPDSGVLGMWPHALFWVVDGLAYTAMGAAALLAGLALPQDKAWGLARRLLLAHGALTPVIAFVYVFPRFSTALLMLGSPWLVTASGALIALCLAFRRQSLRIP